MGSDNMWPEKPISIQDLWDRYEEPKREVNIKLVTHVSKKYIWLFDGQVFWRKKIDLKKED